MSTCRPHTAVVPWAADSVHSGDLHVVFEGQSGSGDSSEGASERVPRDVQLPVFALFLAERFDCCEHAVVTVPHRIHAIIETLPPVCPRRKRGEQNMGPQFSSNN